MKKIDVGIIGAGPSGITAAIYLKRANIPFVIFEKSMPGGKISLTSRIDNYPGYLDGDGVELALKMQEQLKINNIDITFEGINSVYKKDDLFILEGEKETYFCSYVILATGTKEKKLGLKEEEKYINRGISFCAICDGSLYRKKDVAVIGGGNSALEESLYLSSLVNKVYLIHRRNEFRGEASLIEKVKNKENIIIYTPYIVKTILGEKNVESIVITSQEKDITLNVSGIFEYIGMLPSLDFLKIDIDKEDGYALVNEDMMTSIPNLFAIGDVRKKSLRQIVTAVNDGAIGANSISRIRNHG